MLSGNTPDYDLVATDGRGRSVPVQVKAITKGTWQFDAARYVEIEFDGKKQIPGRLKRLAVNPVCVLVVVGEQGGVRPKNPKSTHAALSVQQVEEHRDHWKEIGKAVTANR